MKKWLSVALICSLFVTNTFLGNTENVIKAEENSAEEKVESVTDLDKYENNDLIVVYKNKSMTEKKMTAKTVKIGELEEENETEVLTDDSVVVKLDNREDLKEAIKEYTEDSSVAYVQPNYVYHALNNVTITDTDYEEQWGMNNNGTYTYRETVYTPSKNSGWFGGGYTTENKTIVAQQDIDVNAPEAWGLGTGANREVIVAFVDTGIKYDHEELEDCMWVNPDEIAGDGIDNDGNGYIDDIHGWNFYAAYENAFSMGWPEVGYGNGASNGNNTYYNRNSEDEDSHATHCAGIVAAQANGTGVVGIAHQQNVKIMTVKTLGGSDGSGTTESVVKGIQYAADKGATICNLSLGGEDDDKILGDVMEKNSDMLFCVAAGNGDINGLGYDMDTKGAMKQYPACYDYDNIITVANIQCDGELHYTSNYGSTSVDIAAPGAQIYSTSTVRSGYEYMTGTSMATPMISGIAALIYSYYDDVTIYDVKNMILNSSKKLSSLEGKVVCGGMADAYAALMKTDTADTTATPSVSSSVKPSVTVSVSPSTKPSPTMSATPTITPTGAAPTVTPSITPTGGYPSEDDDFDSWLDEWMKDLFGTPTPSVTPTPSIIPTSSVAPTPLITPTPSIIPTPSDVTTPTVTSTPSVIPTAEPIQTISTTPNVTATEAPIPEPTSSIIPKPTNTPVYTEKPSEPTPAVMPTNKPGTMPATLGTSADDKLENSQIILKTNKKVRLVVHHIPSTIKVTWKSSDKSVATITSNGITTAKAPGKSTITATLSNGKKLSCIVVVRPVTPTGVKVAQIKKKLKVSIRWGKVTGIDGYEVLRAVSKNGRYRVIKDVTKAGTKYYIDKKVTRKTYYYKVRAYKKLKNGSRIYSNLSSARKIKVKR